MTSIVNDSVSVSCFKQVKERRKYRDVSLKKRALKTVEYIENLCRRKSAWCRDSKAMQSRALTVRLFQSRLCQFIRQQRALCQPKNTTILCPSQWMPVTFLSPCPNEPKPIDPTHLDRLFETFLPCYSSRGDSRTAPTDCGPFPLWNGCLNGTKAMCLRPGRTREYLGLTLVHQSPKSSGAIQFWQKSKVSVRLVTLSFCLSEWILK